MLKSESPSYRAADENWDLTNGEDKAIESALDQIDREVEEAALRKDRLALEDAVSKYSHFITQRGSPRAMYGTAVALDKMAELEKSNRILEQSIDAYHRVLKAKDVPDKLYSVAADRCVALAQFRGWYNKAVEVTKEIVARFPTSLASMNKLGTIFLMLGNNAEASGTFRKALKLDPSSGYAKAHLGFALKQMSVVAAQEDEALDAQQMVQKRAVLEEAVQLFKEGIATRDEGVLDGRFFFHLGDALQRLGRRSEADEVYKEAAELGMIPSFWQRSLYNVNGLRSKPIWTPTEIGLEMELDTLKMNWEAIKWEALEILGTNERGDFVPEGESLKDTGFWAQFELFRQGQEVADNCARAPVTCGLIRAIPEVAGNRRGQVKFSVMKSGTHVHPHSGPTNCRLRGHLGLYVPQDAIGPSTRLRVADQYLEWRDGGMFIFDDSFDHEVWYSSTQNEPRVVLIFDIWHPDLSPELKRTLPAI